MGKLFRAGNRLAMLLGTLVVLGLLAVTWLYISLMSGGSGTSLLFGVTAILTLVSATAGWFIWDARMPLGRKTAMAGVVLSFVPIPYGWVIFSEYVDVEQHIRILFPLMIIQLAVALVANALKLSARTLITKIFLSIILLQLTVFIVATILVHVGGHQSDALPQMQFVLCFTTLATGLVTQVIGHISSAKR
jgi:hypothetical protein